ncbi:MAG: hypothetical protein JRN62_04380 [Nitrososphaerota archaeon]|nr:hypothetical protein [Nitrososphaerota archaeon]MDG6948840.1 hypothetical protein [Nitrososphaerota archaeon]
MPDILVEVKSVEASRTSEDIKEDTKTTFSVTASVIEGTRSPGTVAVKFSVNVDTQPAGARLFVSGTATVNGKDEELETILDEKDQEGVPTVFMAIYRRVYPIMYLMAGTLKVPHPAPGLLKINFSESAVAPPSAAPQQVPDTPKEPAPAEEKKEEKSAKKKD